MAGAMVILVGSVLSATPAVALGNTNLSNGTNATGDISSAGYAKDPYYHFNLIFHTLIFVVALW